MDVLRVVFEVMHEENPEEWPVWSEETQLEQQVFQSPRGLILFLLFWESATENAFTGTETFGKVAGEVGAGGPGERHCRC